MNKTALRAIMIRNGDTQRTLAEHLGLSLSRLNAKINGTGGALFRQDEISHIKTRYSLTSDAVDEIFFTNVSS